MGLIGETCSCSLFGVRGESCFAFYDEGVDNSLPEVSEACCCGGGSYLDQPVWQKVCPAGDTRWICEYECSYPGQCFGCLVLGFEGGDKGYELVNTLRPALRGF